MSEVKFRLAEPADAEAFSKWARANSQIDPKDLAAGQKENNPTVLTFVAKKNGVPIVFAPVFLSAVLAHLVPNPDATSAEKKQAMQVLLDGAMAFFVQWGIREIQTLSKPEYGMAKWAMAHHFEQDPRSLFRLDLNREMAEVK